MSGSGELLLPLWAWGIAGALLGLIAGSFLATLVVRWPAGRGLGGRSACDACGRAVGVAELVPLLSFAASRGRCRGCGARIDPRHPTIEAAAAAVGAGSLLAAPGIEGLAGALFGWLLLALGALDLEHLWLPDRLTAPLALLGLAGGLAGLLPALGDRLIGGVAGFGTLWLIGFGYARIRKRIGLGAGDPKLAGAIGLWLGWQALPFVLLLASAAGLLIAAAAALAGRPLARTAKLPFGTLLAVAAWPVWLAAAVQ